MIDPQDLKKQVLPYIKGLPLVILAVCVALFLAARFLRYATPMFESSAKLKLDNHEAGFGGANLYNDFDVFSQTNSIETEVEVLRSSALISKTLDKTNFNISYYRIGRLHNQELYLDLPFVLESDSNSDSPIYDEALLVRITSTESFEIRLSKDDLHPTVEGNFDTWVELQGWRFQLVLNKQLLAEREGFHLLDDYSVTLHSKASLLTDYGSRLDIVPVDKDIAVVRVSLREAVPQKAADFVNALAECYVNDYVEVRSDAARRTTSFIDQQLDETSQKLQNAEMRLEKYRLDHGIINTRQETETGLRKLSQLKLQLVNIEMRETALDSLNSYLSSGNKEIGQLAPHFDAFGDLLFTELIKKLKTLEDEKKDLLLRYTADHELVTVTDEKITDILHYLREGITNSLRDIRFQRAEVEKTITIASAEFDDLPTKERQLIVMERDFQLQQNLFRFLSEKRSEASIATAANLAFHRIIEPALPGKKPVTPVPVLIYGVSVFLALLLSFGFIALLQAVQNSPKNRESLERLSELPVAGVVRNLLGNSEEAAEEFAQLSAGLRFRGKLDNGSVVVVTSSVAGEGKTCVTEGLARTLALEGRRVLCVDANLRQASGTENQTSLSELLASEDAPESFQDYPQQNGYSYLPAGVPGISPLILLSDQRVLPWLNHWRSQFDLVIIDAPSTVSVPDTIGLMRLADHTFYLLRAGKTPTSVSQQPDLICEEYDIKEVSLILNGVHRATSYSGRYVSSAYSLHQPNTSWKSKFSHYLNTYLR